MSVEAESERASATGPRHGQTGSSVAGFSLEKARGEIDQSPSPGLGENRDSLPGLPSNSLASSGGSRLIVMLGHTLAYSALRESHFSSPGSVSGLIASTGHSGSHTPQSMHSSGWM